MRVGTVRVSMRNTDIFVSRNKVFEVMIDIFRACVKHKNVVLEQEVDFGLLFGRKRDLRRRPSSLKGKRSTRWTLKELTTGTYVSAWG